MTALRCLTRLSENEVLEFQNRGLLEMVLEPRRLGLNPAVPGPCSIQR
jgi:hypothetical protein